MELEVIGFDLESCVIAQACGVDRIELCANPHDGGTTPSVGVVAAARRRTSIELFPMIRPRGGDFLFTAAEFEAMLTDVEQCREMGCDGIVTGMLLADGRVDAERCAELIARAGSMQVTFHRAFDRVRDPLAELETIIELGCTRILTSGLQPNVELGKAMLRTLVDAAGSRIIIMAGSGVRSTTIVDIARFTGATAFHSSARMTHPSAMLYTNPDMDESLESVGIDATEVSELRRRLDAYAADSVASRG